MTDTNTHPASSSRTLRLLGAAFLLQAIGSAVSGLVLAPVDLLANSAPDDIIAMMADIAANEWRLRASILGEMVTAGGIVALGAMLYRVLRPYGQNVATVAFSLYLLESALLAFREVLVFELWWTSDRATAEGPAEAFVTRELRSTSHKRSPTPSTPWSSPPARRCSISCSHDQASFPDF